jgi:hypothetical protein
MYRDGAGSAGVTPKAVSVWLLDKRILMDPNRTVDLKPILAILEADAKQTSRLRHPGIVSVIEPLEETKTQLIWVTEEVFGSISAWSQALQAVRTPRLHIYWCSLGKPYTSRLHLWVTHLFVSMFVPGLWMLSAFPCGHRDDWLHGQQMHCGYAGCSRRGPL